MTIIDAAETIAEPRAGRWLEAAEQVLAGRPLDRRDAIDVLRSGDEELLELLAAAYRVRHRWFGNRVHLNLLVNAKCGGCSEDCGYCSQSKVSTAAVAPYSLLGEEELLAGARLARQRQAKTYCIVTSGRRPTDGDLAADSRRGRADQEGVRFEDLPFARAARPRSRRGQLARREWTG